MHTGKRICAHGIRFTFRAICTCYLIAFKTVKAPKFPVIYSKTQYLRFGFKYCLPLKLIFASFISTEKNPAYWPISYHWSLSIILPITPDVF